MTANQKTIDCATFFIGGASDKNRFWGIAPATNLIRDQLIAKYIKAIRSGAIGCSEAMQGLSNYFGYDEMDTLFQAIQAIVKNNPKIAIRLVGHSLGAWQAAKMTERLAQAGISTALLITIDPVGIGYFMNFPGGQYSLPRPIAKVWVNLAANHTIQYQRDDAVADAGIRWHPWRDTGLKNQPTHDIATPYSHADVWLMMTFPGTTGKSAWQTLLEKA